MGALLSLANFYLAMKDPAKAEATFKEALALNPTDGRIYGPFALMYFQQGRFDDGIKLLESTQNLIPLDPTPSFLLANQYVARNQNAEARKVLLDLKAKKEFEFDKNQAVALAIAKRLAVNFMADEPSRARTRNRPDPEGKTKRSRRLVLLGRLQFSLGEYDNAKATLSEPQALNSGQPEVFYLLGSIEAKNSNLDRATEHYQKALTMVPGYHVARVALASVLLDKGKVADARVEIDKVNSVVKNFFPARLVTAAIDRAEKRYVESERELSALSRSSPTVQRFTCRWPVLNSRWAEPRKRKRASFVL